MLRLSENSVLIDEASELPDFKGAREIFLDLETRSGTPKRAGGFPWKDQICGVAITADDHADAYYVPVRHNTFGPSVEIEPFRRWLCDLVTGSGDWINHNVKFDAVFTRRETGAKANRRLVDTLTLAKMLDTDRIGHSLKALCREWLGLAMEGEEKRIAYLARVKSEDFADCPQSVLGEYACEDVLGNRLLYRHLQRELPEDMQELIKREIQLTSVLHEMEMHGFRVDVQEVKKEQLRTIKLLIDLGTRISQLAGEEFSNSPQWIYETLVVKYDLPVLAYHDVTGKPTFNKRALAMYEEFPAVRGNKRLLALVRAIRKYRVESQYNGLFLVPFQELRDSEDVIHPFYNQLVRTGRMSCRDPNIQQQNSRSKLLIHPRPGFGFISCDYSQIEFRLIAHYAGDQDVIDAYVNDPDTDFHTLTASLMYGVPKEGVTKGMRKKAKFINFGVGFGAGKRRVLQMLLGDPAILTEVCEEHPSFTQEEIEAECERRAAYIYASYHERMPGIKRVSVEAANVCKRRGWVFNAYKRRRHLPLKAVHKAFNSIVQGGAMDIIKDRFVALATDRFLEDASVRIVANVHDEFLFECPLDRLLDASVHERIISICETPLVRFSVPIRVGLGVSPTSWAGACSEEAYNGVEGKLR
jgi:DNA polymerase-1